MTNSTNRDTIESKLTASLRNTMSSNRDYRRRMASSTGFGGGAYYNNPDTADHYRDLIIEWIDHVGYPYDKFICQKLSDCGSYARTGNTVKSRLSEFGCARTLAKIWESCTITLDTSKLDIEGSLITSMAKVKPNLLRTPEDILNLNNAVLFTVSIDCFHYQAKQTVDSTYIIGSSDWVKSDNLKDLKEYVKNNWHTRIPY